MDFQLWVGLLSLIATLVGIYYARRQTKIMETQATEALPRAAQRRGETVKLKWWKNPAIPVLLILSGLAWSPYVFGINRDNDPYGALFRTYIIEKMGTLPPTLPLWK
jgi:hypothetical protein